MSLVNRPAEALHCRHRQGGLHAGRRNDSPAVHSVRGWELRVGAVGRHAVQRPVSRQLFRRCVDYGVVKNGPTYELARASRHSVAKCWLALGAAAGEQPNPLS